MDNDTLDAERYRAIKKRYAYKLVGTFIDGKGYSSVRAAAQIDAWADAAALEVSEWEAKTPEERTAYFETQCAALAQKED